MEWIIGAIVLVVLFFVVTGQIIGKAKSVQESDPDKFLDEWFNGRDQVIVDQAAHTLSADAILAGGNDRGYRLISSEQRAYPNTGQTRMIFEKVDRQR